MAALSLLCIVCCQFLAITVARKTPKDVFGSLRTKPMSYSQTLDHFNAYNQQIFEQRWFYNEEFWNGASALAPIIFQVGGEGPNNGAIYGFIEEYAQEIGALIVTAEHRFYGDSKPFAPNASNYEPVSDRLGLLAVEQALADYMELLTFIKSASFANCPLCPTVAVGGSYPGELSVWLRMRYPHIFDMALAASAPIFYTSPDLVSPFAYYEIVTSAVQKISSECVDFVRSAYSALLSSSTPQIIDTIPICLSSWTNVDELQALLYEKWANYAMGNYPPSTSSLRSACERIVDGSISDGLEIWQRFFAPDVEQNANGCLDMNEFVPEGVNATIHCSDLTGCGTGFDGESWDWQACTQNIEPLATNNITDMFPDYSWSMQWLDEHCTSRFNVKASTTKSWMQTQFGLTPTYFQNKFAERTSRIIFSNGENDGWAAGGVLKNMSDTLIAIVIPNGAHHSDMGTSSPFDTPDMITARDTEKQVLTSWILQLQKTRKR